MDSAWTTKLLGEVCTNFDSIRVPVKESERRAGIYPYYGASGIVDYIDGFLFDGDYLLVAEDGENLRSKQTPVAFLAKGRFWVNNHAHIIRGNDAADTRYLMYALWQTDIAGYLTGSTMPKLTQGNLNRIPLPIPPLPIQHRIADILGSLDDKIELNRKMNETLETMARAIFKSWFVDFDPVVAKSEGRQPVGMNAETAKLFPNSFEDSEIGRIPKGWKVGCLGNVLSLHDSKRVPLSSRERAQRQGQYPYYGATSIMDYIDNYLFDGVFLLIGEDGSVINEDDTPIVQYVWGRFWVNNHAHVATGVRGFSVEHLFLCLKATNIRPYITGAVQPKLNQGNLLRVPTLLPPPEICQSFKTVIEPLFTLIRTLTDQTDTLCISRDALLPRLLSGELAVATD